MSQCLLARLGWGGCCVDALSLSTHLQACLSQALLCGTSNSQLLAAGRKIAFACGLILGTKGHFLYLKGQWDI